MKSKKLKPLNINRKIALVFIGIIVLGTLLLCLPFASRNGRPCSLLVALFTATSASCVTGLVLCDTWTQWSIFGQGVILCMIEIGGLGFMSASSLLILRFRKKLNMRERMLFSQSLGSDDALDAPILMRKILKRSLIIQGTGALILALRFCPIYGLPHSIGLGIFHSVSAFCNAGFDILGFETPGASMARYHNDPVACLTLCALIILGGLGFIVWDEILRRPKRLSVYTKLVLYTSAILTVFGTILVCMTEWNNMSTLGDMTISRKILAGLFQSVTCRTAGFAGVDQGLLTDSGKAISIFLMLIGGSSGSTAGGLKTVTFVVLVLFLWTRMRGRESVSVFRRTISNQHVLNAVTLFCIMISLSFVGSLVICATSPVSFTDGLYEAVSALATVGLTAGITTKLGLLAKLLMIVYMYFGRVGILTISLGFIRERKPDCYRYAETNVLIG